jgi:hypothetical protein
VSVEVSVRGEVGDDLERVLGVLERPGRSLPAVGAVAEDGLEEDRRVTVELFPTGVRVREEGRRHHLALRVRIVLQEADARARPDLAGTPCDAGGLGANP